MASTAFVLILSGLLAATPAALAAPPAGEYRGLHEDRGRPLPVILLLEGSGRIGDPAGRIRFEEPWSCGFELQYSGDQGAVGIYSFRGAGAGPCRPLTQGYARLQPGGDGLQLELVGADRGVSAKIRLNPVAKRD